MRIALLFDAVFFEQDLYVSFIILQYGDVMKKKPHGDTMKKKPQEKTLKKKPQKKHKGTKSGLREYVEFLSPKQADVALSASKYNLALSNISGDLYDEPEASPLAKSWDNVYPIDPQEFIPMPLGATLSMLIDRVALGKNNKKKQVEVKSIGGERVYPVAVILPPGYTRTHLPAYHNSKNARQLPFFAYTAAALGSDGIYCAAIKTHDDLRWDPSQYNSIDLPKKIKQKIKLHKENRLLKHLSHCAVEYRCFTAQNIFYDRWEGGIPVSPACNARCGGCISKSDINEVPSPQDRIAFVPTVDEIVEIAVPHLNYGGIISFGQGCEGEPLMQSSLILEAVKKIRSITSEGTINMNTNASMPEVVGELADAGMDTIRVSLNSPLEHRYKKYFNPQQYSFFDVIKSIKTAKDKGMFVSLNYLFMPGVNDREEEWEAFAKFLKENPVDMIQIRNLNTDPDYYYSFMEKPEGKALGVRKYLETLKQEFPEIIVGNFSISKKKIEADKED